jgi:dynein heavy chain
MRVLTAFLSNLEISVLINAIKLFKSLVSFAVEDVFNRVAKGDKHALKNELAKETNDLNNLIALIRTDISKLLRKAVNTLIILDVHARDIVDRFVRDSIMSAKEFAWES